MNAKEKKLERQVEIWTLLGPFIMIMTLTVILIKPTHHQLYIPLAALIGIPICWKWKLPGFVVSLGILSALMTYQSLYTSHDFILWDFLLGIAVALTFAVTALSFKEVEAVLRNIQSESSARLQSFIMAGEKIKALETKNESELAIQLSRINVLQDNLTEKARQLQSYEQIVNVAREELLHTIRQNEAFQQEVFNTRHELALLEQKLEELNAQPTAIADVTNFESEIQALHDRIGKLASEKEYAENALGHMQKELESLKALDAEKDLKLKSYTDAIQKTKESAALSEQELVLYRQKTEDLLAAYTSKEKALTEQLNLAKADKEQTEQAIQALQFERDSLQHKLANTPEEPPQEDMHALRRMEGMYNQLREQFEEKCQTLDETRRELFLVQEELLRLQRDSDEQQKFGVSETDLAFGKLLKSVEKEFSEVKQEYGQETEALYGLVQHLMGTTATEQTPTQVEVEEPQEPSKKAAPKKKKSPKKNTKTTDWANTILSRWSE